MRRATFINIKLFIEGTRVIFLSFTESCKSRLVEVESLLMGATGLAKFDWKLVAHWATMYMYSNLA